MQCHCSPTSQNHAVHVPVLQNVSGGRGKIVVNVAPTHLVSRGACTFREMLLQKTVIYALVEGKKFCATGYATIQLPLAYLREFFFEKESGGNLQLLKDSIRSFLPFISKSSEPLISYFLDYNYQLPELLVFNPISTSPVTKSDRQNTLFLVRLAPSWNSEDRSPACALWAGIPWVMSPQAWSHCPRGITFRIRSWWSVCSDVPWSCHHPKRKKPESLI